MNNPHELYIDDEGILRGYYVYVHKESRTGNVFYVGKGKKRRAWETGRRSRDWKSRVAAIEGGWEVEIVAKDLSEIEAFDLEEELVEKYSGTDQSSTLVNLIPGGEHPHSICIRVKIEDHGWSIAYYGAREIKPMARDDQEKIARAILDRLTNIDDQAMEIENSVIFEKDAHEANGAYMLACATASMIDCASDFLKRRIAWKDFGLTLEDTIEDIDSVLTDESEIPSPSVKPLADDALDACVELFAEIDSGNQAEALEIANEVARKNKEASESVDD